MNLLYIVLQKNYLQDDDAGGQEGRSSGSDQLSSAEPETEGLTRRKRETQSHKSGFLNLFKERQNEMYIKLKKKHL